MIKAEFYKNMACIGMLEITPQGDFQYRQNCGMCSCKSPIFCKECNDFSEKMKAYFPRPLNYIKQRIEEVPAMKVTYKGFTGELVKLEKKGEGITFINCTPVTPQMFDSKYDIAIYDREKDVTHSFTGVKLEDVKFQGGAVSFK